MEKIKLILFLKFNSIFNESIKEAILQNNIDTTTAIIMIAARLDEDYNYILQKYKEFEYTSLLKQYKMDISNQIDIQSKEISRTTESLKINEELASMINDTLNLLNNES